MIEIVVYKDDWALEFRQLTGTLRNALGNLALRIDHIGSTAVPGLAAKDVIDIQISLAAFSPEVLSVMSDIGYSHLEGIRSDHRQPMQAAPISNGKSGFSIHRVNAEPILTFVFKVEPINAMRSSFAIICVLIRPHPNLMVN